MTYLSARTLGDALFVGREALLSLLYPPCCAACAAPLMYAAASRGLHRAVLKDGTPDLWFCASCTPALVPLVPGCPRCADPGEAFIDVPAAVRRCEHCRRRSPAFGQVFAAYEYAGTAREAVLRLKREGRRGPHRAMAASLATRLASELPAETHLVPVASDEGRLAERGFDPADLLANALATSLGWPVTPALCRPERRSTQKGKGRLDRRANVRGAFGVLDDVSVTGHDLCLVDDVLTTGATADEAASVLLAAGARSVVVAVFCRARF